MIIPSGVISNELIKFLSALLNKNPLSRLYNYLQIKNNSWFKDFNWDELILLSMESPYKPINIESEVKSEETFGEYISKEKCKEVNDTVKYQIQDNYEKWFEEF